MQIQVVLYETHSELKAENDDMVQSTVSEINKIAKIHHASLQGKLILPSVTGTVIPEKMYFALTDRKIRSRKIQK